MNAFVVIGTILTIISAVLGIVNNIFSLKKPPSNSRGVNISENFNTTTTHNYYQQNVLQHNYNLHVSSTNETADHKDVTATFGKGVVIFVTAVFCLYIFAKYHHTISNAFTLSISTFYLIAMIGYSFGIKTVDHPSFKKSASWYGILGLFLCLTGIISSIFPGDANVISYIQHSATWSSWFHINHSFYFWAISLNLIGFAMLIIISLTFFIDVIGNFLYHTNSRFLKKIQKETPSMNFMVWGILFTFVGTILMGGYYNNEMVHFVIHMHSLGVQHIRHQAT